MDKIKTVKIKNEDGSISEESYIISVDARNVDMDNGKDLQDTIGNIDVDTDGNISEQLEYLNENVDNLNIDIKKKAYFFNTVADMKVANLKVGDYACTLGYYEINDGGGADYYIVSGNYTDDDGNYHRLTNNLFAKLIIKNQINFRQLGAKTYEQDNNFDNKIIMNKYLNICNTYNKTFELLIPGGHWCFSETLMTRPKGVRIIGEKTWAYDNIYGTAILPFRDNQQYIWKLGGLADYTDYTTELTVSQMTKDNYIDGLCFTTMNGANNTRWKVTQGVFIIDRSEFSTFDNLHFWKIWGNGLVITTSWELDFGLLNIRQHKDPNTYSILFDKTKPVRNVAPNISALTIEKLYFERNDGYIYSKPGSGFSHNHIDYINIEAKFTSTSETFLTTSVEPEVLETYNPVDIFSGMCRYLTIGTINMTFHDPTTGIIYDNERYYLRSIIADKFGPKVLEGEISTRDWEFNVKVSNLSYRLGVSNSPCSVIYSRQMAFLSQIHIGTLSIEEEVPVPILNLFESGNIRIGSLVTNSNNWNPKDSLCIPDYLPAWKYALVRNSTRASALVSYEPNAPTELNLVINKDPDDQAMGARFLYKRLHNSSENTETLKVLLKNKTATPGSSATFRYNCVRNGTQIDTVRFSYTVTGDWQEITIPNFWADYNSSVNLLNYGSEILAGFKFVEE